MDFVNSLKNTTIVYVLLTIFLNFSVFCQATEYPTSSVGEQFISQVKALNASKVKPIPFESVQQADSTWVVLSNLSLGLPIDPSHNWFNFTLENKQTVDITRHLVFTNQFRGANIQAFVLSHGNPVQVHQVNQVDPMFTSFTQSKLYLSLVVPTDSVLDVYLYIQSDVGGYLPLLVQNDAYMAQAQSDIQFTHGLVFGSLVFAFMLFLFGSIFKGHTNLLLAASFYVFTIVSFLAWFNYLPNNWLDSVFISVEQVVLLATGLACLSLLFLVTRLIATDSKIRYLVASVSCAAIIFAVTESSLFGLYVLMLVQLFILSFLLLASLRAKQGFAHLVSIVVLLLIALLVISAANLIFNQYWLLESARALILTDFFVSAFLVTILGIQLFKNNQSSLVKLREQVDVLSAQNAQVNQEIKVLQSEAEETLEAAIQERTFELNIALQELEEANRELEKKNTTDELSGLYNRRYFDQKFLAEYRRSKRELTPLSLVLIDIDHFKKVNDTYGHLVGDDCIRTVGTLIKTQLKRSSDVACRYGGEEFCLILPHTDQTGAEGFANAFRENIAQRVLFAGDKQFTMTVSCGVVTYQQQEGVTLEQLFEFADQALYKAKDSGRNNVQVMTLTVN